MTRVSAPRADGKMLAFARRDQPIDGGEIDARLPFRGRHRRRWIGCGFGMDVHGEAPCLYKEDTHGVRGVSLPCDMVTKLATAFQRTR